MADGVGNKKITIDRISSLPDDILLHIFSFLRTADTIRTSLLSKRFQKLWRLILLDCCDREYCPHQFEKFMEKALTNHENLPRVQKFRLQCFNYKYTVTTVSRWINSAVTASVSNLQELDISVHRSGQRFKLPCSVFSCQKLKFLRLAGHIIVSEIPTGVLFPCLKTLEFESICIESDINQFNKLFSTACPVLEISLIKDFHLRLSNLWMFPIQLQYKYLEGSWVQGNCPYNQSKRVLKHLELHEEDMFEVVRFMSRNGNWPVFEHLTHLVVQVDQEKRISALPFLLEHAPNLTSLELKKASLGHVY
ncbi:hypothetical protein PTKIN_Ptkin11bG0172300 [Pterospermum kingtungense]